MSAYRIPSVQLAARVRPSNSLTRLYPKPIWIPRTSKLFATHTNLHTTDPTFTYRISAAYSAKRHPLNLSRNIYNHDPIVGSSRRESTIQDKHLRPQSGQDSFFVSNVAKSGSLAFGVVDGVGGWAESDVDAADFSHALCEYMAGIAIEHPEMLDKVASNVHSLRPHDLMDRGYQKVLTDGAIYAGGSTACIATASPYGHLEVANLGDSGYLHISPFRLHHISTPQTHAFNTPYQLSKLPPKLQRQMRLFGGSAYAEAAADADLYSHKLEHGDVLLFATDGVWDNLTPQDALSAVSAVMVNFGGWFMGKEGEGKVGEGLSVLADGNGTGNGERVGKVHDRAAEEEENTAKGAVAKKNNEEGVKKSGMLDSLGLPALIAAAVTRLAKEASLDRRRDGPFAKEWRRYFPMEQYVGGKPDDICTVVAVVLRNDVS